MQELVILTNASSGRVQSNLSSASSNFDDSERTWQKMSHKEISLKRRYHLAYPLYVQFRSVNNAFTSRCFQPTSAGPIRIRFAASYSFFSAKLSLNFK